ncbi:ABC transporter permease [Nosocomiicoccus massiliensis]|uniref:ABC transporter permease n=1 Tax=Nosocomiicoccus massiliensis TaxID=1232430 RepID=A0AAF0YH54_9STAP|nr:ABC transporter permease [Nosocomiicoccus massiliensis]WOS95803.1 ABC transporter permease [Nosocomiicoccus massiliensis]
MKDILHAEFFKFKGMFKRYYIDSIAEVTSYIILFTSLTYFIVSTSEADNIIPQILIGVFIWFIGINAIAIFTFILQEEMALGTLEQIFLTKTSLTKMLLGRAISTFIFDSIGGVVLSISTVFALVFISPALSISDMNLIVILNPLLILVILVTMVGIYGFSFILAGLSIIFKRISAITVILNYMFLFIIGVILAGDTLPLILDIFSKFLPITWGVIVISDIFNGDTNVMNIIWLIINSILYFVVGLYLFNKMTYIARVKGTLD